MRARGTGSLFAGISGYFGIACHGLWIAMIMPNFSRTSKMEFRWNVLTIGCIGDIPGKLSDLSILAV